MKQDKTTKSKDNHPQGSTFFEGNGGGNQRSFFQPTITQRKTQDSQKSFNHAPLVQMQNGGMSHPDRPPVAESTELGNAIANGGLTLALYVSGESPFSDQGTFEGEANDFARDHNAVMIENGQAVFGEAAATPVSHIGDIVSRCRQVAESASELTGQEVKIQTLALFTHGLTSYLNFGGGNLIANDQATAEDKHQGVHNSMRQQEGRNAGRSEETNGVSPYQARSSMVEEVETTEGFAAAINNYLANDARVVMYACLTGSTYNDAEGAAARGSTPNPDDARNARERRKLERRRAAVLRIRNNERRLNRARDLVEEDHESGGEGSFADTLRDALNAEGQERQIWGHRTTAHTTGNPTWRVFDGQQQEEEQASNPLFATHSLFLMDRARTLMSSQVGEYLQNHFHQRVSVNRNFRVWIARELPFVPSNLQPYITEWRRRTPVFTDGLIEYLAGRYMQQRGNQ